MNEPGLVDRALSSRLFTAIVLVFSAAIAALPILEFPRFDLDGNWLTGVALAIESRMAFGSDIVFTYGPWAMLDQPSILSTKTLIPALIASVATSAFLVGLTWLSLRRWLGRLQACASLGLLVAPAIAASSGFSARILIAAILIAFALQVDVLRGAWRTSAVVALAFLSGLAVLTKVSNGILILATVLIIAAIGPSRSVASRLSLLAIALGTSVLSTLVWWCVAGQSIDDFAPWARISFELVSGFADAMSLEAAPWWEYLVFGALVIGGFVHVVFQIPSWRERLPLGGLVLWVSFISLRLGFTRHDAGHATQAFMLLAFLAVGVSSRRLVGVGAIALVGATAMVFLNTPGSYLDLVNPARLGTKMVSEFTLAGSDTARANEIEEAKAAGREHYLLEPQILTALLGRSVHIDPQDSNVAWSYELRWKPVPVFQAYTAYTPSIDKLNAASLSGPTAPDSVLKSALTSIDGRNPLWDSPNYTLGLICNYLPAVETKRWLLLDKSQSRCGSEVRINSMEFKKGELIQIPLAPSPNYVVLARLKLDDTLGDRIAALTFKPISSVVASLDNVSYRLPRANALGPLVMGLPSSAGWKAQFGQVQAKTLTLTTSGSVVFSMIYVGTRTTDP